MLYFMWRCLSLEVFLRVFLFRDCKVFSMRTAHGFSLVEVMTVIAFISIMTAVTFVSFSGKRDEAALRVAAREVAAAVRVAQNNALSGVKRIGNNNGLCSHRAEEKSATTYDLTVVHLKNGNGRVCGNSGDEDLFSLGTYTLGNGVTFGSPSWMVSFDVPRGKLIQSTNQEIVLQKNGKYSAVCVLTSGSVIEKDVASSIPSCP